VKKGEHAMSSKNKRNILYFESSSMRKLYKRLREWQKKNNKRFLSISIHKDNGKFCCIALTNPSEVVITSLDGNSHADVSSRGPSLGSLKVFQS
jgi:hypothetical protein